MVNVRVFLVVEVSMSEHVRIIRALANNAAINELIEQASRLLRDAEENRVDKLSSGICGILEDNFCCHDVFCKLDVTRILEVSFEALGYDTEYPLNTDANDFWYKYRSKQLWRGEELTKRIKLLKELIHFWTEEVYFGTPDSN